MGANYNVTTRSPFAWTLLRACHDFLTENREKCFTKEPIKNQKSHYYIVFVLAELGAAVGILNNSLSLFVFLQSKYRNKLLSFLLRFMYVSNLVVAVGALVSGYYIVERSDIYTKRDTVTGFKNFLRQFILILFRVSVSTSYGIMAYLAILRFTHSMYPIFVSYSPKAYTLTYLVLMLIFIVSFGITIASFLLRVGVVDEMAVSAVYRVIALTIVVVFNAAWIVVEKERAQQTRQSRAVYRASVVRVHRGRTVNKLFRYAMWSSCLLLITTLPIAIFSFVPDLETLKSCDSCFNCVHMADYFRLLLYYSCYLDNMWYCMVCRQYRRDLKTAISPFLCVRNSIISDAFTSLGTSSVR